MAQCQNDIKQLATNTIKKLAKNTYYEWNLQLDVYQLMMVQRDNL